MFLFLVLDNVICEDDDIVKEVFPLSLLSSLDEQLSRPKWVVPVRENDELETLIKSAIELAREGNCISLFLFQYSSRSRYSM